MKKLFLFSIPILWCASFATPAHAAIAFRKDCTPNNQSSNVASLTVSCGTTTAGDMLVIVGAEYNSASGATTVACTDGTNTYVILHAANAVYYCYALNIAGGTVTTTVTFTGGTTFSVTLGEEFSGVATSAAADGVGAFNNSIASCTACTMPAVTTTAAGDLVLTAGGNAATNNTFTAGSGYTISTNGQASGGNQSGAVEYQIVGSATTYTPVLNITTGMSITGYTVAFFAAIASSSTFGGTAKFGGTGAIGP